jgi:ribosomal protein L7/L12
MDEYVIFGIIAGTLLLTIAGALNQLRGDIQRTNLILERIAKHIGVPDEVYENIDHELIKLIAEGKKIKAVKRYRLVTGMGLKESKKYIDSLSNREA